MTEYNEIFGRNLKWVERTREADPEFFDRLGKGQNPNFLYVGCADSRVPANVIMDCQPGEVFVHRNVANIVPNTDLNSHSVIEYAVDHLEVDHIVVCGHYGCGGVLAAMEPKDLGLLNGWLREVRDVYRLHRDELDAIKDEEARYRRLVELNVQEQCIHIMKVATVQKHYLRRKRPIVHGWVFDVNDGILHDLELPFEEILEGIREIYRLDV
ncbi:MAG: carbonic anhydrase [Deltaproteobacteria bacterium]|nr:carbonic anhydrase [Deltaproteobacteria bacterium]